MKSHHLLLCALIAFSASAAYAQNVQWTLLRFDPTRSDLYDVEYLNSKTAIAVGANRVIRIGDPAGDFPVVTHSYFQPALQSVAVGANGNLIVCGGDSGVVGFSFSKGVKWEFLQNKELGDIRQVAVHPVKGTVLIASSKGFFRWQYSDVFQRIDIENAQSVAFTDGDTAFVAYGNGRIHRSLDGGFRWAQYLRYTQYGGVEKMRYRGGVFFMLGNYFILNVKKDGHLDTTYIAGARQFTRPDICVSGNTWFAVDAAWEQHCYSTNKGLSWEQSVRHPQGCVAVAGNTNRVVTVGRYAARSFGHRDSIASGGFKTKGFEPFHKPVSPPYYNYVGGSVDSIFLLMTSPNFQLELITNEGRHTDTVFRGDTGVVVNVQSFVRAGGRTFILMDSVKKNTVDSVPEYISRYVVFASSDLVHWDTILGPVNKSIGLGGAASDFMGNVYYCVESESAVAVIRPNSNQVDLLPLPFAYPKFITCYRNHLVVANAKKVVHSTDEGLTWSEPFTFVKPCLSLSSGRNGRIYAWLDMTDSPYFRYQRVDVSDDFGASWQQSGISFSRVPILDSLGQMLTETGATIKYSQDNGRTWYHVKTADSSSVYVYEGRFIDKNLLVAVTYHGELLLGRLNGIETSVQEASPELLHDSTLIVQMDMFDILGRNLYSIAYPLPRLMVEAQMECLSRIDGNIGHQPLVVCVVRTGGGRTLTSVTHRSSR